MVGSVASLRARAAEAGVRPSELSACGVVVPGIVDDAAGVARWSANLGWRDLVVVDAAGRRAGPAGGAGPRRACRPGRRDEIRCGTGVFECAFMPIGTGIAGALMLDGRVVVAEGWSGELGHVVVTPDGPPCGCGGRGCLEAMASAAAIERAYAAVSGVRLGGDAIAALVADGDEAARGGLGRRGRGARQGGGHHDHADRRQPGARGRWARALGRGAARTPAPAVQAALTFQRMPTIVEAALGDRAGCLGAACLAFDVGLSHAAYPRRMSDLHCAATLLVARHGDAEYGHPSVLSDEGGWLSAKGIEQTTALATSLTGRRVAAVRTSPLARAVQSGAVAAEVAGGGVAQSSRGWRSSRSGPWPAGRTTTPSCSRSSWPGCTATCVGASPVG